MLRRFFCWGILFLSTALILDHIAGGSLLLLLFFSALISALLSAFCFSKKKELSIASINLGILVILVSMADFFGALITLYKSQSLKQNAHDLPNIPFHLRKSLANLTLAVQEPGFQKKYYGPGQVSAYLEDDGFYEPRNQTVSVDKYGFRKHSSPYTSNKPQIVVLGDSFVFGYGNDSGDTIPALLEKNLKVPVYNMGVYAASVPNGIELLNIGGIKGLPSLENLKDIVVVVFSGNDFRDGSPYRHKNPIIMSIAEKLLKIRVSLRTYSPLRKARWINDSSSDNPYKICRLEDDRRTGEKVAFNQIYIREASENRGSYTENDYRNGGIPRSFDALNQIASRLKSRVTVVYIPSKVEVYGEHSDCTFNLKPHPGLDLLKSNTLGKGFNFLDLTPYMRTEASNRSLLWWRDDTHLNPRGTAFVASHIRKLLSDQNIE